MTYSGPSFWLENYSWKFRFWFENTLRYMHHPWIYPTLAFRTKIGSATCNEMNELSGRSETTTRRLWKNLNWNYWNIEMSEKCPDGKSTKSCINLTIWATNTENNLKTRATTLFLILNNLILPEVLRKYCIWYIFFLNVNTSSYQFISKDARAIVIQTSLGKIHRVTLLPLNNYWHVVTIIHILLCSFV